MLLHQCVASLAPLDATSAYSVQFINFGLKSSTCVVPAALSSVIKIHFIILFKFSFIFHLKPFLLEVGEEGEEGEDGEEGDVHMCGCDEWSRGGRKRRKSFVSVPPLRDESKCWLCLKLLG